MVKTTVSMIRYGASALSRRFGTGVAGMLIAQGVPPTLAEQVFVAVAALGGLALDVFLAVHDDRQNRVSR